MNRQNHSAASLQRPSDDPQTAELLELARALRRVAWLAGQCADQAHTRAARDRVLRIEIRFDEHLRQLARRIPHEPNQVSAPRIKIKLGAL